MNNLERPGDTMSTHTPRAFSYDGFGVNSCGMYRERLATFSQSIPDAQRKELGALWVAAPTLLEALKGVIDAADDPDNEKDSDLVDMIDWKGIREAIRLAEGKG